MDNYQLGRRKLEEKDFSSAGELFLEGLSKGDPRCAYGLVAIAAVTGRPMDEALATLEKALPQIQVLAEQQDAEASFIMGRCFETGSAVELSIPTAISWYLRSAGLGNADAMFNLGCIYMKLDSNAETLALEQFRNASVRGCPDADLALAHYYRQHPLEKQG